MTALKGVLKHAGKSVSTGVRSRVYVTLKDLIRHDDDQVRTLAASIFGIMSQVWTLFSNKLLLVPSFGSMFQVGRRGSLFLRCFSKDHSDGIFVKFNTSLKCSITPTKTVSSGV